ncbi:glycosyltransferase family 25 protein [Bradyrhizobium icense]|uniref:glycosyltransferase family 25 protein n=1 Tax=Bradyrhizobium icense TaxID=1274631 RepID=UPI0012EA67B7|nr:glycosyltransferase family 25 protein [Bradyrhizobium icense]
MFFDYFDRIAVIHLPARTDRFRALDRELSRAGFDIGHPKVVFPEPPMPNEANGFRSQGVYGNFLSHLGIIEGAYKDNLDTVLVLEDDAIFSNRFRAKQPDLVAALDASPWDMCFIGHSLTSGLPNSPTGLIRFSGPFIWAHCYAVHRRVMPRLIQFMQDTLVRPSGHPDGGRMYIDATFTFFRKSNPDVVSLISSPCLSIQRGSQSSLNAKLWYVKNPVTNFAANTARAVRDEFWRQGWLP